MTRGKHANASTHRRMVDAEEHVVTLKKLLAKEQREHEVTKRIAARIEALEDRCRALEQDLHLATSDEVRALHAEVAAERGRQMDLVAFFAHFTDEARMSWQDTVAVYHLLSADLGVPVPELEAAFAKYENRLAIAYPVSFYERARGLMGAEVFDFFLSQFDVPGRTRSRDDRRGRQRTRTGAVRAQMEAAADGPHLAATQVALDDGLIDEGEASMYRSQSRKLPR